LSAIGGIAMLWGTIEPVGFIGALMAGIAVAVFLGLVFTRLVCTDEAPVANAVAGGALGKLMGTEPAGAKTAPAAPAAAAPAAPKPAPAPEAKTETKTEATKAKTETKAEAPKAKAKTKAEAPKAKAPASDVAKDDDTIGTKPAALSAPKGGQADNLKEIKGVGPKLETLLNEMGFYHFDQIASWGEKELAWMDANLKGFKGRASRDNWVEQAKILAAGGETEFSKRVEDGDVY
jgi:predicted flap endonuclease-1-like 5' DNA nuclease